MTILIVEDNPTVRRLIRRATSDLADSIYECEDGADALASYIAHRPDIVLMDVRMPRMDGLTATRQILRHDPYARVIIVTDYDDDQVRAAAREAGASAYALKHDLTELDDVLQTVLDRPPCSHPRSCQAAPRDKEE